jgi:hypothetical protein
VESRDAAVAVDARASTVLRQPRTSRIIANRLSTLLVILGYESFLADPDYFDRSPFPEARERLGVPRADECFGFSPLLALGGRRSAVSLEVVDMREHVLLISSVAGPLP